MVTRASSSLAELMTVPEVAEVLGVDRRTVLRMIGKGRLLRCGCNHCGAHGGVLVSSVNQELRRRGTG